jgi:DNA-directed RNA polymerase subunit RPC12/RpoP
MRYLVTGADRATGDIISRRIEAPDESAAEQIAQRSMLVSEVEVDTSSAAAVASTLYSCANCQRTIGALEQPYKWGDNIVCPQCCALLQQSMSVATAEPPRQPIYRGAKGPHVICPNPNCGYVGRSMRKQHGSMAMTIILLLLWLLPGILYAIFCRKRYLACPKCGVAIRDE